MGWKFYNSQELSNLLGISEEELHRKVKRLIKRDFKLELKRIGIKNPDILLNDDHLFSLADPRDHDKCFNTEISIFDYL